MKKLLISLSFIAVAIMLGVSASNAAVKQYTGNFTLSTNATFQTNVTLTYDSGSLLRWVFATSGACTAQVQLVDSDGTVFATAATNVVKYFVTSPTTNAVSPSSLATEVNESLSFIFTPNFLAV